MARIMKILGAIAVVALLVGGGVLLPVVPVAAEDATVTINAPAEAAADSDFTASVDITEVTDFDACQYDVTFDDSVLRLDDVTSGLIGSTTVPVDVLNEISPGTYRVVQNVSGLTGATGSGYLAVLHFHVVGSGGESSDIDLSGGVLSNTSAEEITATWVGDTVNVSDTTAPTVTSTSPTDGATGVAVTTVVTATFSEAMDASTITTSSFTLDSVAGSVSYNSGTYTATFTPSADLSHDTTYTATLSTAITDVAGNPLASAYTWSFTTAPSGGVTVTINAPAEAAADSDFTASVDITEVTDFDACQYDVTFDDSVLRLDDVTSGLIGSTTVPVDVLNEISPGTWRVVQNVSGLTGATGSGYLAVLHFHVIGSAGSSSDISLSGGVLSNTSAQEITATWVGDTVNVPGADTTPPTVVSTSPTNGAGGVALSTVVTATFSEAMDASTITTSSFTLDSVAGSVSYNSSTFTATFTPDADLAVSTTYTATLSTAITDVAGNPLASAYSWSFTTAPAPGVTVSVNAPAEAAPDSDFTANVDISSVTDFDACNYDVTFDDSVLRLDDVTSGLIGSTTIPVDILNELSPGTYRIVQNVPGLTGVSGSGYLAVLHFHVVGSGGDSSDISLSNGMLSNTSAEEITATWIGDTVNVVGADTTPPTVVSTSPTDGATGVPLGTVVTATFSEAMDASTITTSSFTLDSVAGSVSYNSSTFTATFTPSANLDASTTYTATLSTAITDVAGNPLASAYSWSFTVGTGGGGGGGGGGAGGSDTTPPTISDVSVANITKTSADISWRTDEKSSSQVEYWASPGTITPLDTEMVIKHSMSLTDLTPGDTYHYRVMSSDDSGNLAVSDEHAFSTLPGAAAFTTSELSVSPSEVYIGETVTISVLVNNTGDGADSYTVTLKIDGEIEATREITLNPGASEEVTFAMVKDVAGSYSVEVNGLGGSFTVKEKPAAEPTVPPTEPPPETPSEEAGINWPVIWGIMAGVLLVGVLVFWVAIRRRA